MAPQIHTASESKVNDLLSWASAVVTLAIDPDNPDRAHAAHVQLEHRPALALNIQAQMLRDTADQLDAAYAEERS
ncbi:hypothetical protein [Rhodococcus pyridinivorans]|uniref:hypothetical protein n=1 Tax=Rhodococcus pyridinivorans TaxID=103816 RepID=UPI003AAA98CD